jgi:hypothetical protein
MSLEGSQLVASAGHTRFSRSMDVRASKIISLVKYSSVAFTLAGSNCLGGVEAPSRRIPPGFGFWASAQFGNSPWLNANRVMTKTKMTKTLLIRDVFIFLPPFYDCVLV